ncbi:MAG: M23 family metallopeptidase [Pelagibacteraceae bacterium]|mgnify:FL=1|jgi:murein DD-endopeptidase MepM/ murein hydrolase activator NlpD|nr:M23 family metallopeptidase [Pelagibacteraceae bacterium]MBT6354140.1 M23 family metallopeptidase [Pelagibacteraceae bacterium]
MKLNFKYLILFIIFLLGILFFLTSANKLSLENKKNTIPIKLNENQTVETEKRNLEKNKIEAFTSNKTSNHHEKQLKKILLKVEKGQTFSQILNSFNIANNRKFEIINAINSIFNLRGLKINQKIFFFINDNEIVKQIIIELDFKKNLVVDLRSKINIEIIELKTYTDIESKEFNIKNSLYSDGIDNKIPNVILIKLIQLFSFDLDFQRDIRENTQVSISYQKISIDNKINYELGDIEYAKISIKNNNLEYFKFLTDDGFIDYFNREGKNVKKSILKTPLDGAKLSSNFGMRKHPISGFNKMHKGIDFAAPKGTPIYAGGNGVVEVAGVNGGYGKYIRIRHNNEYKTAYAHLNSFKKGIRKGVRVNQGEIIGYVGSTGKSTGPHLHYEIIYQNKQINPLTLKLPSGKILKGDELNKFKKNYKMILANHLNNLFE